MKKSTMLGLVTGIAIGVAAAGTAEFTTTKTGEKLIDGMEQGTVKDLGEKTRNKTTEFNDLVVDTFNDIIGGDVENEEIKETNETNISDVPELAYITKLPKDKTELATLLKEYDDQEYTILDMQANNGTNKSFTLEDYPYQATAQIGSKVFVLYYQVEKSDTTPTASLDTLGAGDPPLKIGNITIDENDVATSLTNELGIYDMTARRFASNIQAIRKSEYQAQYIKVIAVIDGFVTDKKISDKQGWAVLLKITNGKMFDQSFKSNEGMGKLFVDATNSDKNVKAFYDAGNLTSTGGAFNPQAFNTLLAYAANMETVPEPVSKKKEEITTPRKRVAFKSFTDDDVRIAEEEGKKLDNTISDEKKGLEKDKKNLKTSENKNENKLNTISKQEKIKAANEKKIKALEDKKGE